MTNLYFTFAAHPPRHDGTHVLRMYLKVGEPTMTNHPGDERKALRDVREIVANICDRANHDERNDEGLLSDDEMPPEANPVFVFAIGVDWDRVAKIPSYKRIDFHTLSVAREFTRVYTTAMELYDYIYGLLKEKERKTRAELKIAKYKFDAYTLSAAREQFDQYLSEARKAHTAYVINKVRFDCPRLKNGYCSPAHTTCPCYAEGRCEEMTKEKLEILKGGKRNGNEDTAK